ncbi:MAG: Fe-S-containing protein [Endomicrobium sp.]|jgi:uncharacterized membrane protein|nr:Fe-S-containing protein [Endomicrobium sp.]
MLKYFIQIIQVLLQPALIAAMIYALVNAAENAAITRKKYFARGCLSGALLAFAFAMIKYNTAGINREYFNIFVLSAAVLSALFFVAFSRGFFKNKTPKVYKTAYNVSYAALAALLFLYVLPDVFLYPANFVMSGESMLSTDALFKFTGCLAGGIVVFLSAAALFKACSNLPYKIIRILFTASAAVVVVGQISEILQFLLARRIIPMSRRLFHMLLPVINHKVFFLYAVMAITVLTAFLLWKKSFDLNDKYSNPAQFRKIKVKARSFKRWSVVLISGYILAVFSLTALKAYDEREVALSPAEPMTISADSIIIPIENVNDGHLHRFAYNAQDGTEVRFIVIKKNDTAYGVGLDACDICGETGYYERDNEVICKLCDVVMNKSTIGFRGGCNPVPLAYLRSGPDMIIKTQDLEKERGRFK